MVIRNSMAIIVAISAVSFSAFAGDVPKIGGEASITVNTGMGGIINVGASAGATGIVAKQAVGSVLHGDVTGALKITVDTKMAGILNVGGGTGAGKVEACQSIGTIGSDCSSASN